MMLLLFLALVVVFVIGAPLFVVMLFLAAIGGIDSSRAFDQDFSGFVYGFVEMGNGDAANIFATIPLFIYAGYIMAASQTATRLVRVSNAALGWMPGGLGIVTILTCAIYTTFTGASGVTIVALGSLLMPALVKQKYPERFSLGLVTGTGSVGLLFPPALPLFIFGTVLGLQQELTKSWATQNPAWEWETERFLRSGILPGLVLIGCISLVVVVMAVVKKLPRQKFDLGELGRSLLIALPELLLPFAIIAWLATGQGDIAQVASLTVVYLLVLEIGVFRDLRLIDLWHITKESMALIGAIFIIVFASKAVTNYLVTAEVPKLLVEWTREHIGSREAFLMALNVLLIVVGMMMDIFSAILIVLPLVAPIAHEYGVNPYHLGVIFLLNLEIGYLTPPVGLNLFIASFKFRRPVTEVVRAILPFMGAMVVSLLIVTYVPALTDLSTPAHTPRGTLDNLVQIVRSSATAVTNVKEVPLPNGKVKRQQDCNKITDTFDRDNCLGLFTDVTQCRNKPAAEAAECEKKVIDDWFQAYGEPAGGGSFEDQGGGFEGQGDEGGGFEDQGDEGGGFEEDGDEDGDSGGFEEEGADQGGDPAGDDSPGGDPDPAGGAAATPDAGR